ncbi:MAG: CDP-alcohol phosphatidyltransferase family protein [Acidimicrobiales bacterium]
MGPVGAALAKTGLKPDHLTALGLVMAVPAAFAIGNGHLVLGLILLIVAAVPDLLDGALAKASGTASVRGAFFDSVSDRVTDGIVLGGVAWYLQSSRHGHASLLPFAVLAVSMLISYERAKAESLGFSAKGGLMERAERIILLCLGLLVSPLLVPILWIMLVLTAATAVQRFVKVWRQATAAGKAAGKKVVEGAIAPTDGSTAGLAGAGSHLSGAGSLGPMPRASLRVTSGNGADRDRSTAHPTDSSAAMSERWRAWRQQQLAQRQATGRVTPSGRPGRLPGGDGARRQTRWEERRAARLRAAADDADAGIGRRHSTRRP